MTAPPLPTFVPQDAWYNLTIGNINPSIADPVPDISYLSPSGDQDGLIGSLDGGIVYLAGTSTELDGGQSWLMWVAASMQAADNTTIFNPWVDTSKPGRWVSTGTPSTAPGGISVSSQFFQAGATHNIAAVVGVAICYVFIQGRAANLATTLNLPGSVALNQIFRVKDTNGDAGTYNIVVVGAIDGEVNDTISDDYGLRSYVWNNTEWSVE